MLKTIWTTDTILALLYQHRQSLHALGMTQIGVFGSYVRGEHTSDSDIDLLFTMTPLTWRNWMDAWDYLEGVLGTSIDLVPEEDLRPELRPSILSEVRYVKDF